MPIQSIVEFILYITPGFIAISIYRFRYPAKDRDSFFEISNCIIFGLIILSVLKWFDKNYFNYFFNTNYSKNPGENFILGVFIFGIISGLLGLVQVEIRSFLAKKYKLLRFLSKSTNTIWQFINDKAQNNWVVVFLDDGTIYLGWISKYIYDPNDSNHEFLLSEAAKVDEKLNTNYIVDGLGVYLNTKNVKRIELVKGKKQ